MSPVSTQIDQERAELESVLHSGIFARAPNLASFLKYICERYFEGESDNVKEYCIAIEALNRQADFDPKRDSIVRVEAHRLRKRLAEFYSGTGAAHSIHIEIPNGQYSPTFRQNSAPLTSGPLSAALAIKPPTVLAEAPSVPALTAAPAAVSRTRWRLIQLSVGLTVALLLAFAGAKRIPRRTAAASATREIWQGSNTDPVPGEFRFLAGYHGDPYTDRQGRIWQPDAYFEGGLSVPFPDNHPVAGLPDPKFPKGRREGTFHYAIPARQGTYEVHLHFIGTPHGDPSDPSSLASFRVSVNNQPVLDGFDPISDSGGFDRLYSRVLPDVSPAKDGKIHLAFDQISSKAFVNAVEVLSTEPGRVRPVRIVAAKSSVVDSDGSVWVADEDAMGGVLVERHDSIQDTRLKMLFAGEHYGNFSYRIPMPPGRYRVKLYFAETYFGSKLPYAGGATGARLFNVFGNGVALLRVFDVAKEAGGPNRAIVKVFDNVEPNAQGNIVLDFVPLRNYAEVNALEVAQMN
jgi:hypothetical protein